MMRRGERSPHCPSSQNETLSHQRSCGSEVDHVGTAALGCPVERSSTILFSANFSPMNSRAALDRTAEGGCPAWFCLVYQPLSHHAHTTLVGEC